MKNKRGTGIKTLLVGIILCGLFAFALITGGIMTSQNNYGAQSIGDDQSLAYYKGNLSESLTDSIGDANSSLEALGDSPLSAVPGATIFEAVGKVWKTLKEVPSGIYNITFGFAKERIFGEAFGVVFAVLGAIIILLLIFGVIKLVSSGQDE